MSLPGQAEKVSPRAEVERAYEFFKAHDWIKGGNSDRRDDGTWGYCTQGAAIYYGWEDRNCWCGNSHPTANPHAQVVLKYLEKALPGPTGEMMLTQWNDEEDRTREEVNDLWLKAIVLAHMEETQNGTGQD